MERNSNELMADFRAGRYVTSGERWTLVELMGLIVLAAISSNLAASGAVTLSVALMVFVVATRVAIVDYTLAGSAATATVMLSGVIMIVSATCWLVF